MATKRYSTYAEIEKDLEILKLEKEIHYQKLVYSIQKTKESFTPQNVMTDMIGSFSKSVSNPYFAIISSMIPFILKKGIPFIKNWIFKRKGGE